MIMILPAREPAVSEGGARPMWSLCSPGSVIFNLSVAKADKSFLFVFGADKCLFERRLGWGEKQKNLKLKTLPR